MQDRTLKRIARDFRRGLLGKRGPAGMCAAVCRPLAGFLHSLGERVEIEDIEFSDDAPTANHFYLRLADGRVLDPTADQFGLEPIYLGPMPQIYLDWQEDG